MSGIAAGGGLSARGLSSHGIGTGAKGQAVAGGGGHTPGQKPQPHGGDFGRDGALARGQGFSQRDAFSPAKQAQKPQHGAAAHQTHSTAGGKPQAAAHQTHASSGAKPEQAGLHKPQAQKSAPQEAQKPQVQQNDATKAVQQSALRQMDRQQAVLQNMVLQQQLYSQDILLHVLMDMRKRFLEWVKELFQLFAQPATH